MSKHQHTDFTRQPAAAMHARLLRQHGGLAGLAPEADALQLAAVGRALLVAVISPSGEWLSANENCLNILGLSWQELADRNILDVFGLLLAPGELGKIRSRLRQGGSHSLRLRWPRCDGRVVQLDTWIVPMFDADENIHKIMLLAADVTARVGRERKKLIRYRRLAGAFDRSGKAVVVTDADFAAQYANAAFSALFGLSRRQLMGKSPAIIFGADEKNILDRIRTNILSVPVLRMEATAYNGSGQKVWVSLRVRMFTELGDRGKRLIFTFADITSAKLCDVLQHTALEALAREHSALEVFNLVRSEVESFLFGVRVVMLKMDEHGALHGTPPFHEACDPEAFRKAISLPDTPVYDALKRRCTVAVRSIKESSYPLGVKELYAAQRIEAVLLEPVFSGKQEVRGLVAFFQQTATERNVLSLWAAVARICAITAECDAARAALLMYTHHNAVTGLPNFNTLSAAAGEAIRARRRRNCPVASAAALCVNIERFRRINKHWGLKASNDMLKIVAQRLSAAKGPHDLLAHAFEDEFMMISLDSDAAQARETGKRIQTTLAAPILHNAAEVVLSANIGVSIRQGELSDEDPVRMIEEAQNALFRMKPGERARINFYDDIPERFSKDDISLEARLMHAIKNGKLHLCYQPQVSLQHGAIYGMEALCRWQEADLGVIAPDKFIALAEETGLIGQLSDWVLREVCRQMGDWRRRNIPVPTVAVNLSALNFHEADLPDKILRYLAEYDLQPGDLRLELTETTLLDNDPVIMNTLHKAKERGLTLSLDDFGTGYSSLSCLRNLPITEMKLDRSFVQDLHVNDVSRRLSKAIVRVGESLNLCVLAEGVENKRQLALLKKHHYHVVQGHFLAKPLPPDELEDWLGARKPSNIFV